MLPLPGGPISYGRVDQATAEERVARCETLSASGQPTAPKSSVVGSPALKDSSVGRAQMSVPAVIRCGRGANGPRWRPVLSGPRAASRQRLLPPRTGSRRLSGRRAESRYGPSPLSDAVCGRGPVPQYSKLIPVAGRRGRGVGQAANSVVCERRGRIESIPAHDTRAGIGLDHLPQLEASAHPEQASRASPKEAYWGVHIPASL